MPGTVRGISQEKLPLICWLPMTCAGFTLEWSNYLRRDPTAVEASGLRPHALACDETCNPARIEGNEVFQFREISPGSRVAPCDRVICFTDQCPVRRNPFPLTHRAARRSYELVPRHIIRRQIKCWRACRFENTKTSFCTCNFRIPVSDLNQFAAAFDNGRTRVVPDRLLSRPRFDGEVRT